MATTYLIARDETGAIIAKRATQHVHNKYRYATARGTFHTRLDLVPAGQKAYPVETMTPAEFRALTPKKADDPAELVKKIDQTAREIDGYRKMASKYMRAMEAFAAGNVRQEPSTAFSAGFINVTPDGERYGPTWGEDTFAEQIRYYERWIAKREVTLVNYRKRLAAAERKAAKA